MPGAVLEDMEIEQDYSVKSLKEYETDFFRVREEEPCKA